MSQQEVLDLINQYNNTDRKIIKSNLKRIMKEHKFKAADIMNLGYSDHNVYSWTNSRANNIPMHPQALHLAVNFNFDVRELLKVS